MKSEQTFNTGQEREEHDMKAQRRRKKYRITSKFRFITTMMILFTLLITGLNAVTGSDTSIALTKSQYMQVKVVSGDTLWDLANQYKSDGTDTRKAVYEICRINEIDASDMKPDMVILIPENL